jgi:hypothetical protein
MGKARALKLGITKGVVKAVVAVASHMPAQCPICRQKFDMKQLMIDEKLPGGVPAEEVVSEHIRNCIIMFYPQKTITHGCGQKITMGELNEHLRTVHGWTEEQFKYRKSEGKGVNDTELGAKSS